MSDTAISFENISKQYRLGLVGTGTIAHDLNRWWHVVRGKEDPYLKIGEVNDRSSKAGGKYVWALKDITFDVKQGEVLGIIGKNGAGKSTLLKILSRVTSPSTGIIKAKGRIASLLEVGTGFHPEMTGRENIYMNGSIMGMTKAEIKRKLDEIVDFAGVEKYIDTPVKRYSSGMTVRLGFAIAAHLEPEILVVDEVLAVGDAEFQKKAIGKMQDVSTSEGRTVLFVSHNMGAVETLCTKGIILRNGLISYQGGAKEAVEEYIRLNSNASGEAAPIKDGMQFCHHDFLIESITINGSESNIVEIASPDTELNFCIRGEIKTEKKIDLELKLYDVKERIVATYYQGHMTGESKKYEAGKFEIRHTVNLPENMTNGEFWLDLNLTHPGMEGYVDILKYIRIVTTGLIGATGVEFDYSSKGLVMLR